MEKSGYLLRQKIQEAKEIHVETLSYVIVFRTLYCTIFNINNGHWCILHTIHFDLFLATMSNFQIFLMNLYIA